VRRPKDVPLGNVYRALPVIKESRFFEKDNRSRGSMVVEDGG
jgi:hypothetical protein